MVADVIDVFVDFIGNHDDLGVTAEHFGQSFHLFGAIHGAGGIGGAAKNEGARAGRDGGLKLCGRDLEVLLDRGFYEYGGAVGQTHHVGIAHPVGSGDDHLVAFIYNGEEDVANGLLGTVSHDDLCGRIFEVVFAKQLGADGFAQVEITGHGAVARPVVVDGLFGGDFNVIGRIEVGFADAEVDDVHALCFEFGAFLRHRQRGRRGKSVETGRKMHDAIKNRRSEG